MLDHLIVGGQLIDGTGLPARPADIGVRDGTIVAVAEAGTITADAANTIDATGLVVCPGFVDPHVHYDAQLFWDPYATPSNVHGVTSMIAGNCGFSLAPIKPEDADYTRRMMAKVEGMPLQALESGVRWDWHTFGDYLDRLEGNVAINVGFLVGHCAIRRYVMGEAAVGNEATSEQLDGMVHLLRESIAAGALGLSTTLSRTHSDGDGQPVASRWANRDELVALCTEVGAHDGTTLEGIVDGCLEYFSDDDIDLLTEMSAAANRPINWNVLTVDSKRPDQPWHQLDAGTKAAARGGKIVALTMPVLVPMNMSFRNYCALNMLPGWGDVLNLPLDERMTKLRDQQVRAEMLRRSCGDDVGVFARLTDFGNYVIGDTYSKANEGLKWKVVADIAAERGDGNPFDTLLDIVLEDDLRTVLWPRPTDNDDASWSLRQQVWADDRAMLGGSDAGAHLDRMCGSTYTTRFLADTIRGRKLVPIERAIHMMTEQPAELFGLHNRGVVREGFVADLVVFDPETVNSEQATLVEDLPGGTARLTAGAQGITHVLVNGIETVRDNAATGTLAGRILRSGTDTDTVLP
ncbi:MAG: amidohydrolase family protein [Actinobacteria bacterium]|nr:amidohydrolase family protein [Actinomycetota bacterium]